MASPKVKLKRSAVASKRPSLANLELGELALNTYDGKLFVRRDTSGVGIATTVSTVNPWTENYGSTGIAYSGNVSVTGVSTFSAAKDAINANSTTTNPAINIQYDGTTKGSLIPASDGLEIGVIAGNHISMNLNRHGSNTSDFIVKSSGTELFKIDSGTSVATFISTDTSSSAGPELKLYRNSSSPADADYIGQIKFAGESDTGVERNYAKISGKISDASNGTEDGIIEIAHIKAGSQNISARFKSTELMLLNGTDFSVAGDSTFTGNILAASDSTVDIGTNSTRFANGYFDTLYGDGSNLTGISGGISNVVEDTTPQLGGTLDTNGNLIQFGDSSGTTDDRLQFGASQDLSIYHNGADSYVSQGGNGNLFIRNTTDDADVVILSDNGSVGTAVVDYFRADGSTGEAILYHYGTQKLATKSTGIDVTGTITADGLDMEDDHKILLGTGDDLEIYHDGTNSYVSNTTLGHLVVEQTSTGDLILRNTTNDRDVIIQTDDGSGNLTNYIRCEGDIGEVGLYHYGSQKLATKSTGIDVTGLTDTDTLSVSGGSTFNDTVHLPANVQLRFDSNNTTDSLRIYDDGSNSRFESDHSIFFETDSTWAVLNESGNQYKLRANSNNVLLYHSGNEKFKTTSSGAVVTGVLTATSFSGDGSNLTGVGGASSISDLSDATTNSNGSTIGLGLNALANDDGTDNKNTALGYNALNANTSGNSNTAVGYLAGQDVTTGYQNSLLGDQAGQNITSGYRNTASGYTALNAVTTGYRNTGIGYQAGDNITTGYNNIVIGNQADASSATAANEITLGNSSITSLRIPGLQSGASNGDVLTYNSSNGNITLASVGGASSISDLSDAVTYSNGSSIGLGLNALANNDGTDNKNVALGLNAFTALTSGSYNTAIGWKAGEAQTTATQNTLVGASAGQKITTGPNNTFLGIEAGFECTTGSRNTGVGRQALDAITSGQYNVAMGYQAMGSSGTGASSHTAIGYQALKSASTSSGSVALGYGALTAATSGGAHVAIGYNCLKTVTIPNQLTGVGYECLDAYVGNDTNGRTTAMGYQAAKAATTPTDLTVIGNRAMYTATTGGSTSTVIGGLAAQSLTTAAEVTAIGYNALGSVTTGGYNVAVGKNAGDNITTGTNNIVIGSGADASSATATNEITLGDASITSLRIPGLQSGASNGDVLTYNSSNGNITLAAASGGGISNVVEDTTPQLGGTLDTNGNLIQFGDSGGSTDDRLQFGDDQDMHMYFNGTSLTIDPKTSSTSSQLNFRAKDQVYLTSLSGGVFLRANNQSVIDMYGGSGGGIYFHHNGNDKLKLEGGNWTVQGSATFTFDGDIKASSDSAIDIGTNSTRFANGYFDTLYGDGSNLTGISGGGASEINDLSDAVTIDSGTGLGLGTGALANDDGSDNLNTAVGYQALNANTSGSLNVALGYQALKDITTGHSNVAIGYQAMHDTGTGVQEAVAIGRLAQRKSTASSNVSIGYFAHYDLTSGGSNIAIGSLAGQNQTTGNSNVVVGTSAFDAATTASHSVALGGNALKSTTTMGSLTAVGYKALEDYTGYAGILGYAVAIGHQAAMNMTTPYHIVAIGYNAATAATTGGTSCTLVGSNVAASLTTAGGCTAVGYEALQLVTTGSNNTALGKSAGDNITTGINNIVIGNTADASSATVSNEITLGNSSITSLRIPGLQSGASDGDVLTYNSSNGNITLAAASGGGGGASEINGLSDAKTDNSGAALGLGSGTLAADGGSNNTVAIGKDALNDQTSGNFNCAVGNEALSKITTNFQSAAFGIYAGRYVTGSTNTFLGYSAGQGTDGSASGSNNVAVGEKSMQQLTSGNDHTAVGYRSLRRVTSGMDNVAVGYEALDSCTTGSNNCVLGHSALGSLTTGSYNIAIGYRALTTANNDSEIAIGYDCFAERSGHTLACGLGYQAGKWNQGARNTAIGHYSVGSNGVSDGADNTGVGYEALKVVTGGNANTAVGKEALVANTDGSDNTAVGYYALKSNTSAQRSTAVGYQAVEDSTTADYATGFGAYTLRDLTTGNNNTAVGAFAGDDITTGANNTCIGYQATASSGTVNNEITLGNSSVATLRCNTQTISSLSDARDKTDVQELPEGLDFISKLNPVKFKWQTRDGNSKDGSYEAGFIAQELQSLQHDVDADYLNLVMDENPDRLEASYGKLVPMLVKAIQELKFEVEHLKANK
jgi:hypothetical protein|tara:strand:- start:1844 stop:8422 length:6579 start_codon:yes stop_codon:yes gene_type:complete